MLRFHHGSHGGDLASGDASPAAPPADGKSDGHGPSRGPSRLNLLLSSGSWRRHTAVDQLPHLLEPMGIASIRVETGEEAEHVIRTTSIHIAFVDMAIPLRRGAGPTPDAVCETPGGSRVIQLLRRLDQPPPLVILRSMQTQSRESTRGLCEALREGAFAVVDQPVQLESILEVMRRILRRHYSGLWPT